MAVGVVTNLNADCSAKVDEVKVAYAHIRRLMDSLIELKAASDASAVAIACCNLTGSETTQELITLGQTAFDNFDAALGGMTTANNALSKSDPNAS